jgi:cell division ATPase FtsA
MLIKMSQTLSGVLKQIHNSGHISAIAQVFVTYASPWYLSQSKGLSIQYNTPTVITRELLRDVIAAEEKQFLKDIKNHTHSELYANAHIIERRIVDMKLNGYSTHSPYQKKAERLDLSLHTSFVSEDILTMTKDCIDRYFNCRSIRYFSFPLVAFNTIQKLGDFSHDSFILDIRGETSDISLIKNGALWESLSFPIGTGSLLRYISEKTNSSIHIASSLLHMQYQRKALPEVTVAFQPIVAAWGELWVKEYLQAIRDLTSQTGMAKKLYVIIDPNVEKFFRQLMEKATPEIHVQVLKGYEFKEVITGVTRFPDTPLAIETYQGTFLQK